MGPRHQLTLSNSGLTEAFVTLRPCSDLVTLCSAKRPALHLALAGGRGRSERRLVGGLGLLKLWSTASREAGGCHRLRTRQVSWTHIKSLGQNGFCIKKESWQEVRSPLWNLDEASPLACQGHPGWVRAWSFHPLSVTAPSIPAFCTGRRFQLVMGGKGSLCKLRLQGIL